VAGARVRAEPLDFARGFLSHIEGSLLGPFNMTRIASLSETRRQIIGCDRCPRLRRYCADVAAQKKAAHRDERYWGRPVPGFGDPHARLLLVGLAPAAHGANRTGRVFTGDGSGDFLMAALHRAGFANIPTSRHAHDGLHLTDAYITAAVRCAPPDNKPTREELARCGPRLVAEFEALRSVRVIVALGRIAFDAVVRLLGHQGPAFRDRPRFAHGAVAETRGGLVLIASYHPSRQNTNTGRLTPAMLDEVFEAAHALLNG
jgi:uracil-DNA glycosylase family 4